MQTLTTRLEQHVAQGGAVIPTTHPSLHPLCVPLRTIMLGEHAAAES